ncbi:MAG: glycosyltransferase family 25 protein [Parachlamydiaceae bacterium]|nr:glycosyltransferase family 25 protein [Parachlamydiaceae bacterium]
MFDFIPSENCMMSANPIVHEQLVNQQTYSWDLPFTHIAQEHLDTMSPEELDNNWHLSDFFGTVAVINLPQDTARLDRITKELNAIGTYDFEVFPAIDGRKDLDPSLWMKLKKNRLSNIDAKEKKNILDRLHQGEAGCYMSHYLLLKQTKEAFDRAQNELKSAKYVMDELAILNATNKVRKYSRILILEDDSGFGVVNAAMSNSSTKNLGLLLREALKTLPRNWDMLYLMCAPHEKTKKISPHLYKLKRSVFANAYVVNYTMYEPILSTLKQIEDPEINEVLPVDKAISRLHYKYNVYAIYPSLAFQFDGVSTIDSISNPKLKQCQPILKKKVVKKVRNNHLHTF